MKFKNISLLSLLISLEVCSQMLPKFNFVPNEILIKIDNVKSLSRVEKKNILNKHKIKISQVQNGGKICHKSLLNKKNKRESEPTKLKECLAILDANTIQRHVISSLKLCKKIISNMACHKDNDFLNGLLTINLAVGESVETKVAQLKLDKSFENVQPNYIFYGTQASPYQPDDPKFLKLWGFSNNVDTLYQSGTGTNGADANLLTAWGAVTDCSSVTVAVLDSGVDYMHPDLINNMWDDGLGSAGYDYVDGDNDPMDTHGHGTHVAGIIGAEGNNNLGVTGTCWSAKIMAVRVLNGSLASNSADIANGIDYAVLNGAKVINMSFVSTSLSSNSGAVHVSIQAALTAGVTVVAAAGNNGTDNDTTARYPCNFSGFVNGDIICVGSLTQKYTREANSNNGTSSISTTSVDLAAPGEGIYSTDKASSYSYKSGTSMSTAFVSGVAAMFYSFSPSCGVNSNGPTEARQAILGGAKTIAAGSVTSNRGLDATGAIRYIRAPTGLTVTDAL